MTRKAENPAMALADLLAEEQRAVIAGDFDTVSSLYEGKSRLLEALGRWDNPDAARIKELQAMLERNQALLEAAKSGIQDVMRRLQESRAARSGLTVYDQTGRTTRHANVSGPRVVRRA